MSADHGGSSPAPAGEGTLSILVVDDESDLREMLTRSFSREGHQVSAVPDGHGAIDRASTDHYDIVLLDVALGPGPDGYEVCRTLRGRRNVVPIIMLTALESEADAVLGLEAGADDYVTKPFEPKVLVARIRALLRRARGGDSEPGRVLLGDRVEVIPAEGVVRVAGDDVHLTRTEFRLLCEMTAGPGRVFSREQLLDAVWGYDYFGETKLVDVHIHRLRAKIEADPSDPAHVVTVRGLGYKVVP